MNRQEQLRYCKSCSHHKFDASKGIICSITNDQATFIETCTTYKEDPELKHRMEMEDIRNQLHNQEADKGKRFANYIIDLIVLYALSFFVGVIYGISLLLISPDSWDLLDSDLIAYLLFIITGVLYFTLFEVTTGRTIGKYITKTKVVTDDGQKLTIKDGLIRSVSRFIPFDAFSFLGDNGWHDKWSNTKVVKIN